jgi:hypothetical protein
MPFVKKFVWMDFIIEPLEDPNPYYIIIQP